MNRNFIILISVFLLGAAIVNFAPMPKGQTRTEEWLTSQMPATVDSLPVISNYKMDKLVYTTLEPFGIVSNIYGGNGRMFDVTVISSNTEKSFHDPRICFSSQGMEIKTETTEEVDTPSHGKVPLTIVEVGGRQGTMMAAYTYQGPGGRMMSAPNRLMNTMFFAALKEMKPQEGVFYRFISQYPGATKEELKQFIVKFFADASQSSHGYL